MKKAEVAVATTDGKAYFNLVNELKRRGIHYTSLKPTDPIPFTVRAVITTPAEASSIRHGKVITYTSKEDAEKAVERALQNLETSKPPTIIVGVDVGKTSGLAILADGEILHMGNYTTKEDIINAIEKATHSLRPSNVIVKLGKSGYRMTTDGCYLDGTEELRRELIKRMDCKVKVMLVDERGTTALAKRLKVKRKERDVTSALEIAFR
ncbi:MAG: hypothetical protein QXJ75_04410 [Candidatus Bathyarchaeia archaeon]